MRVFLGLLVVTSPLLVACEANQTATPKVALVADVAPATETEVKPDTKTAAVDDQVDAKNEKPDDKAAKPDGKAVFEANCIKCHSATAGGVNPPAEGKKPSDLSGVSEKYDAKWLKKYLLKEEKLGEREHPTKHRGTEPELDALVSWLMSLKPAKK